MVHLRKHAGSSVQEENCNTHQKLLLIRFFGAGIGKGNGCDDGNQPQGAENGKFFIQEQYAPDIRHGHSARHQKQGVKSKVAFFHNLKADHHIEHNGNAKECCHHNRKQRNIYLKPGDAKENNCRTGAHECIVSKPCFECGSGSLLVFLLQGKNHRKKNVCHND